MTARRRLVAALAFAGAVLGPAAAASADPLTVGQGKLGERVAAECRRAGAVDDASCHTGIGRRVVREEVAAYERSALHRTLRAQQRLGDVLPLSQAPFIGTHNSFNDVGESPTLSHTDSNQQLTLTDQLRLDVRSLEIDVHWLPSPRGAGFAPVVCHGTGPVGCSTERLLADRLVEVDRFLDTRPDDVLLLYLEDQIDDPAGYEASAKVVRDVFGPRLYTPRGTGCQNLPLDLTRRDVRRAGAQVVVVGDCGTGAWQGVSHAWPGAVRFEDRARRWTCAAVPADAPSRIVRYYEDSTFLSQTPASSPDDGLSPGTVRAMLACGVDLFGFDQLLPGDGRLEALAWSWREEPARGRRQAGVQGADGRWDVVSGKGKRPAACLTASGAWTVTGPVDRDRAAKACEQLDARFAVPRTAQQNLALLAARGDGAAPAWLARG